MTNLERIRKNRGLTVEQLAERAFELSVGKDFEPGDKGHLRLVIKTIETGIIYSPKPRKTYEWTALSKALNCSVDELMEE